MGNEHSSLDCGAFREAKERGSGAHSISTCYNDGHDDESEDEVIFNDMYDVDQTIIGTGKFSVVKLCWRKGNPESKYALKEISTSLALAEAASLRRVHEEIYILKVVGDHPGITKLVDADDSLPDRIRLVLDLCVGGELYDRIQALGNYPERDARLCIGNLLKAIAYVHSKGIMHRDLKPENILLVSKTDNCDIKISDFGLARISRDFPAKLPRASSICGSDFYLAPELIKQQEYGREIDIWAIGVITYCVVSGSLPFFNSVLHKLYRQIVERDLSFPDHPWRNVSKGGVDFVLRMLQVQPGERPTAELALRHPWIAEAIGGNRLPRATGSDAGSLSAIVPPAQISRGAPRNPLERSTQSHMHVGR